MSAGIYTLCFLLFSVAGTFALFLFLLAQQWLPGAPAARYLTTPTTSGTLPDDSVMFVVLVLGTILLLGALSFLPVQALGPIAEAFRQH
jgi:potassium-transporting ATPase potassium-binding subunit